MSAEAPLNPDQSNNEIPLVETGGGGSGRIETALATTQAEVEGATRSVAKLAGTMRAWRKACVEGNVGNIEKTSSNAAQLLRDAEEAIRSARQSWNFDAAAYLESPAWREEVIEHSRDRHGLRVIEDTVSQQLLSAPVAVQAVPNRGVLRIGKSNWPNLRPSAVAAELKRLRDRISGANSQEFLESLYGACKRQQFDGKRFITFREAYDLFCLAPGYKKENPPPVFGIAIYSLDRSGIRTTRAGDRFRIEYPSGTVKERDIFLVRSETGQELKYWGIQFPS